MDMFRSSDLAGVKTFLTEKKAPSKSSVRRQKDYRARHQPETPSLKYLSQQIHASASLATRDIEYEILRHLTVLHRF